MNKERPKVGIGAIVWRDGKALMVKRHGSHGAGTWSIPGGHLEFGESWEGCAARELLEEVGVEVTNFRFLCATNDIFKEENKHYISIFLECDWVANEPEIKEPDKILAIDWRTFTDLPSPLFEPCWTNLRASQPQLFQ